MAPLAIGYKQTLGDNYKSTVSLNIIKNVRLQINLCSEPTQTPCPVINSSAGGVVDASKTYIQVLHKNEAAFLHSTV
jgi:hypothetical protein